MSDIRATNFLRSLSILMLAASTAAPLEAFADRDQKCVDDCRQMGYQWSFCDSRCSFNDSKPRGLDSYLEALKSNAGIAGGYIEGERQGIENARNKEEVEHLRLQNEILRRQLEGSGTPPSPQPAHNVMNRDNAAEPKDAVALTNLGVRYAKGDGVPKDSVKAVELFRKAAAQGYASAMNNLGWMYANGEGVSQSHWQALDLYRVAAERGSAQANANLGNAYEIGQGVPKNYNEALAWYRKAANLGHEGAKQRIAVIEKTLNQRSQTPQTNVAMEMTARSLARNEGCEIASINNVQPPTGFNFAYEISCSDSSIRKYNCNSSDCSLISVVPPMGFQTKSKPKWLNP